MLYHNNTIKKIVLVTQCTRKEFRNTIQEYSRTVFMLWLWWEWFSDAYNDDLVTCSHIPVLHLNFVLNIHYIRFSCLRGGADIHLLTLLNVIYKDYMVNYIPEGVPALSQFELNNFMYQKYFSWHSNISKNSQFTITNVLLALS